MISLVMAVKDNWLWTEKGILSIERNTTVPYELILVDNGSQKETAEQLQKSGHIVLRNENNLGCASAWNQGIRKARGDYVCVLNNDIEVPKHWLKDLREFYEAHDYAWVSPAMREGDLDYDLDAYAKHFAEKLKYRVFEDEFRGVAFFAEKSLYERLGYFDENFRFGKYEDEDYYFRMRKAGLRVAVTSSVLIHHYGSKTVIAQKQQQTEDFERANRKVFMGKWKSVYMQRKLRKWRLFWRKKIITWRYQLVY